MAQEPLFGGPVPPPSAGSHDRGGRYDPPPGTCDCGTDGCCDSCKGTAVDRFDHGPCFDCYGTGHRRESWRRN